MGAWVNDRYVEAGAVLKKRYTRRTKIKPRSKVCDGGGSEQIRSFKSSSSSSLLPLRRQFARQLYEWPVLSLFKSRTKPIKNRFP